MNRRLLLIVASLTLALLGTAAVFLYVNRADERAVADKQAVSVVFAVKRVPAGTPWATAVKGGYFREDKLPEEAVPLDAIPNVRVEVEDKDVATGDIPAGQVVVRQMFADKVATTGVLEIPGNRIAISIAVPLDADVAGFVQRGSQVAIFTTFKVAPPTQQSGQTATPAPAPAPATGGGNVGQDHYVTRLLLKRVDVIATSQAAPGTTNGSGTASGSSIMVTVAVTQAEAERIILARKVGELYLALLTDDEAVKDGPGVDNRGVVRPVPVFPN